jgi:putative transposase
MSNHVHLVLVPWERESLALALKHTHGRYATYWNAKQNSSGHAWQGRYYSCPLDEPHLWAALRYTELNPVRAGMVEEAESWIWSSARAHCGLEPENGILKMEGWRQSWNVESWRQFLAAGVGESEIKAIRQCTHTGRPLGTEEFVKRLEEETQRSLSPRKGGRPANVVDDDNRQSKFLFGS